VFFSYAIVTHDSTSLYVDEKKLGDPVKEYLKTSVKIRPYNAIFEDSTTLYENSKQTATEGETVPGSEQKFALSSRSSWALVRALGGESNVEQMRSPITDAKSVKNETELEGMRACHVRDGAALIEYFAWLEESLKKGEKIDEAQAADQLEKFRS
jgi:Xaa-Pro aminopeptidase